MRCVEDVLREAQGKAALIEYLANCAVGSRSLPVADVQMFNGLGDVAGEIKTLIETVQRALDVDALGSEVRSKR
jgi:hypothetical protein